MKQAVGFNERILRVQESATLAIDAKIKQLKAQGKDIIGFGAGEPNFGTPENIGKAGIRAIQENFTKYTSTAGIMELREAISHKFKRENQIPCTSENVIVGTGAKQCLYNAFNVLLNEGDEVIIPAPYWVSYVEQVKLCGGVPVIAPAKEENQFKITVKDLAIAWSEKTKLLVIGSPCNPTGTVYSEKELREIANWALGQNVMVISDEVYEKLVYEGKHFSMASMGKDYFGNTVTVNAVSKSYAMTGWRIGYCGAREDIVREMIKLQSHTTSHANSIAQKAALEAIAGPQDSVEKMKKEFKKRRDLMMEKIGEIKGMECVKPEGAFFTFPNVSNFFKEKIGNSLELCNYLLERANVGAVPGEAFGSNEHVRLSFSYGEKTIMEGMERIKKALKELT